MAKLTIIPQKFTFENQPSKMVKVKQYLMESV